MAAGTPARADRSLAGVKVLVVEDEFVIAWEVGIALHDLGCVVIGPVASGREALAIIGRERPDIGLLDVLLRDGDAGPVAAALRSIGVPFAVATGYPADVIADPLLRAALRLGKPYGLGELERVMLRLGDPSFAEP